MAELLSCSTKRFATGRELSEAYPDRFRTDFQLLLPPEKPDYLITTPIALAKGRTRRFATCGKVCSEKTMHTITRLADQNRTLINWHGNMGRPFLGIQDEELGNVGITPKGLVDKQVPDANTFRWESGRKLANWSKRFWKTPMVHPLPCRRIQSCCSRESKG